VTLQSDTSSDQTIDFGYLSPAAGRIGDFVWHDLDRDGIQDAGEPGINGVTVRLEDVNGNVQTTVTAMNGGGNGYYQFTGLEAGTYTVSVDATTLPPGLLPTASAAGAAADDSNGSPAAVALGIDESNQTIDFGYITPCSGTIGDFVWHDRNQNGHQDAGEPGLDGVTVRLKNAGGDVIASTTTLVKNGQHGFYQFTGLCAGTYTVDVDHTTVPAGFSPTAAHAAGSTTQNDSNGSPTLVVLSADDTTDTTVDFGYIAPCTGTIGDFVWRDLNGNGIQDADEPGIEGATVYLRSPADNTQLALTLTDGSGRYAFAGLCPGTYRVEVVTPAGLSPTPSQVAGSTSANDSNGSPALVTLPWEDSSDLTIDFGFVMPCTAAIGDFVWKDLDGDGIQDPGEPGIPGVTVTLDTAGGVLVATTTTDASGGYLFGGLCSGSYVVQVTVPPGFFPTGSQIGNNPAIDSNGSPAAVTLTANNAMELTIDFGFVQSTSVCVPDGGAPGSSTPAGQFFVSVNANGDIVVRYDQDRARVNDNSYGTTQVGWPGNRKFHHLVTSDQAQFIFRDATGKVVLDFHMDYLSAKSGTPSGYASLGPAGNDGHVNAGNPAWILAWDTSMAQNLNDTGLCASGSCTIAGVNLLVTSPPADATYQVLDPVFGGWNFTNTYYMTISRAAFGAAGFGSVTVGEVHNSPVKSGPEKLTPEPCVPGGDPDPNPDPEPDPEPDPDPEPEAFATFTQGGWGSKPAGNNPGRLLLDHFTSVYPSGVTIGGTKTARFTSAKAIEKFLPAGGTAKPLKKNHTNPASTEAGVFAGQVLALRLNVDFSDAGVTAPGLAAMTVASGQALAGYTVAQVLALANQVLGGNASVLPPGVSVSTLNDVVDRINNNFNGGANGGFLVH
jgi:hypothetical protein